MPAHPILHVIVTGFHHTRGCQVEFCYPPLRPGASSTVAHEDDVPPKWQNLPNLMIPDGCHAAESGDVVYFILPSLESANRSVFGIACTKQTDSSLIAKADDVTRNYVQKSVAVLSRVPLYSMLREKLTLITSAYFAENDFSKVDVLKQMYTNLTEIADNSCLNYESCYMGVHLDPLLKAFKHRALELFKLLLLERKIIFEIHPTSLLCDIMMGLISLFPCLLESGLYEAAAYYAHEASALPTATGDGASGPHDVDSAEANPHGFPLRTFTNQNYFLPYASLDDIERLRSDLVRAFCVGVTNGIFEQQSCLYDCYITIDAKGAGNIRYVSAELAQQTALTSHDTRFMADLLKTVAEGKHNPADFIGNDDWMRLQFYVYTCSAFNAARDASSSEHVSFGQHFVRAWRETLAYQQWAGGGFGAALAQFDAAHPASSGGGGGVSAHALAALVGRGVGGLAANGAALSTSVASTTRFLSAQGTRLRSSLASWVARAPRAQR